MRNKQKFFEFKADFIIAGTMYVNNKKEITYKEIEKFIKDLHNKITKSGNRCLLLFSSEYLKEVKYDYDDLFYIGDNFIALNKNYDINYLIKHFLAYSSLEIYQNLQEIKNNLSNTTEREY